MWSNASIRTPALGLCYRRRSWLAFDINARPNSIRPKADWYCLASIWRKWKWKCVIFKCYSSEKLNILHEVVPTWYSFYSWVDWSNADKVSCSRKQHTAAGVRTVYHCIQNRHSSQPTNMLCYIYYIYYIIYMLYSLISSAKQYRSGDWFDAMLIVRFFLW